MLTNLAIIKYKHDSTNQSNVDGDLPTRNMLSTLAPKKNDLKIWDVINESVSNSSNRTKVNPNDDIVNNKYCK